MRISLSTNKERSIIAHELFVNIPQETLPTVVNALNSLQWKKIAEGAIAGALVTTVGLIVVSKIYVSTHHQK